MSICYPLYIDNTNTVTLSGLQNSVDDSYINNATVSVTIVDSDDTEVGGATWPITLDYVAASNGIYRALIPFGITITEDEEYFAVVTAVSGSTQANWKQPVIAKERHISTERNFFEK